MTKQPEAPEWVRDLVASHWSADGPGLAVGIVRGTETLCSAGFGLSHIEIPSSLTSQTLLPIASITKHMTALCALIVEREGRLALDAKIGDYLPELPAEVGKPSLRQLLHHLSGLRCHLDVELFSGFTAPRPDGFALSTLTRLTSVNAAPGAWQVYGNAGFHLVSRAIERVTGGSFADAMRDRLFAPLGMKNTRVAPSAAYVTPGLASLYTRVGEFWSNQSHLRVESLGEGGVCSDIEDMLVWAKALRMEDSRIDKLLWRSLKAPAQLADQTYSEYGLGLGVGKWRGLATITHSGLIIGQSSTLLCVPEADIDIIILANTTLPTDWIARQLLERVVGAEALAPAPNPVPASDYASLIGKVFEASDLWVGFGETQRKLTLSIQGIEGAPLQVDPTTGALVVATNLGPLTISLPQGKDSTSLVVTYGGQKHRANLQDPPDDELRARIMSEAAGAYACEELACTITIALSDTGTYRVTTKGPYGGYTGEAVPLTRRVLRVKTPHLSYLLRLERDGGRITGVGFDTLRTRNLAFQRTQ